MLIKTIPQLSDAEMNRVNPRLIKIASNYRGNLIGTPVKGDSVDIMTPLANCQRDLAHNSLIKYIERVEAFDWNLFGQLTVVRYADGTLAIVDGQHKVWLARLLTSFRKVPAQIIDIVAGDEKTVPLIFAFRNGVLTKQASAEDNFWALVLAGDIDALHYFKWLKAANLTSGKANKKIGVKRANTKFPTVKKCIDRSGEATVLASTLLQDVFDGRWIDNVFHGLVTLFTIDEEFKTEFENENSKIRQDFEHWFRSVIPTVWGVADLRFTQYRNASKWEYGVAWGLWKSFCIYSKNKKGQKSYSVEPVYSKYRDQVTNTTKEAEEESVVV